MRKSPGNFVDASRKLCVRTEGEQGLKLEEVPSKGTQKCNHLLPVSVGETSKTHSVTCCNQDEASALRRCLGEGDRQQRRRTAPRNHLRGEKSGARSVQRRQRHRDRAIEQHIRPPAILGMPYWVGIIWVYHWVWSCDFLIHLNPFPPISDFRVWLVVML